MIPYYPKVQMSFELSLFRNSQVCVALGQAIDLLWEKMQEECIDLSCDFSNDQAHNGIDYAEQIAILARLRQNLSENLQRHHAQQRESFKQREERQQREFDVGQALLRHESRIEKIDKAISNAKQHNLKNACEDLQQKKERLISSFKARSES